MLSVNKIGMYLGYIVIAAFLVYVVTRVLSLNNKVVEGLRSKTKKSSDTSKESAPDKLLDKLKSAAETFDGLLRLDKYKADYQDILLQVGDVINLSAIEIIVDKEGNLTEDVLQKLATLSSVSQYTATLDKWLDDYSDSSGSSNKNGSSSKRGGLFSSFKGI